MNQVVQLTEKKVALDKDMAGLMVYVEQLELETDRMKKQLLKQEMSTVKQRGHALDQSRQLIMRLIGYDQKFNNAIKGQPTPFNLNEVREALFRPESLTKVESRYSCMGHVARHIGRFKD